MTTKKVFLSYSMFLFILILCAGACKQPYSPRPRGYMRVDFPEKEYRVFRSECNFSFEYPGYGQVKNVELRNAEPCWYNINFEQYSTTIHLTYKSLQDIGLSSYVEDIRRIVYKHIIKADDIIETRIAIPERKVYGMMYDIKGNTASAVNFYLTDSCAGFLSGSLYFNLPPDKDSLAPAIQFFREDIVHLIHTFSWE